MPIFRSIRWRLIASFTLVTLLTVTLLGVLVLSLMDRYVVRQETAYLNQNATALAQQSELLFSAPLPPVELRSLARTASLLGNFRVKILDANEDILVDSAVSVEQDQITWLVSPTDDGSQSTDDAARHIVIGEGGVDIFTVEAGHTNGEGQSGFELPPDYLLPPMPDNVPTPRMLRIIRQTRGEWGPLLHFEIARKSAEVTEPLAGRFSITSPTIVSEIDSQSAAIVATASSASTDHQSAAADDRPWTGLIDRLWQSPLRRRVVTPIQHEAGVVGYVELSSTPGVAAEALSALRRLFLMAAAGVSVVAVAVGLVMSRSLTAPLRTLTAATAHMNAGNLAARATVHVDDEIGQLARSFNSMADALEKSFADLAAERDALRHFVADASHELRTPITALRTFNELLQDGAAGDAAVQTEFLAESGLQLQRLERITDSLLNLSRLDGGLVELAVTEVHVADLVGHVADLLRPLAVERAVTLLIAPIAADLVLRCDRQQMERALTNLVENGLKFTPALGQVRVGAEADAAGVTIWVEDTGIGIVAAEQTAIFRRFYRGQNATTTGSGLGLAIVQSILKAHGGTVTVESEEGTGSRFILHL